MGHLKRSAFKSVLRCQVIRRKLLVLLLHVSRVFLVCRRVNVVVFLTRLFVILWHVVLVLLARSERLTELVLSIMRRCRVSTICNNLRLFLPSVVLLVVLLLHLLALGGVEVRRWRSVVWILTRCSVSLSFSSLVIMEESSDLLARLVVRQRALLVFLTIVISFAKIRRLFVFSVILFFTFFILTFLECLVIVRLLVRGCSGIVPKRRLKVLVLLVSRLTIIDWLL